MSHFYGTEYEILAGFGPVVGSPENFGLGRKVCYFWGQSVMFLWAKCFLFVWFFKYCRVGNKELRGEKTIKGIPILKYLKPRNGGILNFLRQTTEIFSICFIFDFVKPLKICAHLDNIFFHSFQGGTKGKNAEKTMYSFCNFSAFFLWSTLGNCEKKVV